MVEVMTDKATVTITSPQGGPRRRDARQRRAPSSPCTRVLVVFELDASVRRGAGEPRRRGNGHANGNGNGERRRTKNEPAATAVGDIKETPARAWAAPSARRGGGASRGGGGGGSRRATSTTKPLATPATRKLARDMDVDLRAVPPTGPQGRVTKDDVEAFAKAPQARRTGARAAPARPRRGRARRAGATRR